MKLIFCPACRDIVRLTLTPRSCTCGDAFGVYDDDGLHAFIGGSAIPVGFANSSFRAALRGQPASGDGKPFNAFVIPVECPTIDRVPTMADLVLLIKRRKSSEMS